jgi:hypothetical protein
MLVGGKRLYVTKGVPPAPPAPLDSLALLEPYTADVKAVFTFQRKAGTNVSDVPVVATFSGGNGQPHIQARIVKIQADTSRVEILGWRDITSVTTSGNVVAGLVEGVPVDKGYTFEIRDGANHARTVLGVKKWNVGIVGMLLGQSNQIGTLGGAHSSAIPAGSNEWDYWQAGNVDGCLFGVNGFYPPSTSIGNGSQQPSNTGGLLYTLRVLNRAFEVNLGKRAPVSIIPWAYNSTSLADLYTSSNVTKSRIFSQSGIGTVAGDMGMSSAGYIFHGDFEFITVIPGEAENGARDARKTGLIAFCEEMFARVSKFGRDKSQLGISFMIPGTYSSSAVSNMEQVRSAAMDLDAHAIANGWDKVRAFNLTDMDSTQASGRDGLHFTGEDVLKAARRQAHHAMWLMGIAPYPARGPKMVSGTRSAGSDTSIIAVQHDGGNALLSASAGALTGFKVFDNNGAAVAATVTINSPDTFAVACPPGTVYPIKVGFAMGKEYVVTNAPTDNAQYPFVNNGSGGNIFSSGDIRTGLPLMHTPVEQMITVA